MLTSWILLLWLLQYFATCNGIYNSVVSRGTDITSQIVKMGTTIIIVNDGPSSINTYDYFVDEDVDRYSIRFFLISRRGTLKYLNHVLSASKRKHKLTVDLGQAIHPNTSISLQANCYIYDKINSFGANENDTHLAKYTSNLYYFSKYKTKQYFTVIGVNKSDVVETTHTFHGVNPADLEFSGTNLQPFTYDEVKIIYKSYKPFYRVTHLKRNLIYSHWHNILVEEEVHVTNVGPPLRSFQLYRNEREKYKLVTYLPELARDIILYDNLGIIHNLEIKRQERTYVEGTREEVRSTLIFHPRFPLLRSYKAHYILRYMLPTYAHIRYKEAYYQAQMFFFNDIFPDAIIENVTLRIVLPDGATVKVIPRHVRFTLQRREIYGGMLSFARFAYVYNTSYLSETDIHAITMNYNYLHGLLWVPAVVLSIYLWFFNLSVCLFRHLCWKLNGRFLSD